MKTGQAFSVVITGAASGIGRALALECRERGFTVYATDLKTEAMADLQGGRLHALKLDVNSAADIAALVQRLAADGVVPDLLVNNAGFGAVLPMLDMSLERLRNQFETNVFSVVALCQAVAPGMIARGAGTIVNIGSVSGVMTTPFAGAYCATKAALHALSDALRMELKPFGVKVVTVLPAGIRSNFGKAAASGVAQGLKADSLYAPVADAIAARAVMSQGRLTSITAEQFASQMMAAVLQRDPASVIGIGPGGSILPWVKRLVPLTALDLALSAKFKLGRLRSRS